MQGLFEFMLSTETPHRIIGDNANDSDALHDDLNDECIEMIAPHRKNRKQENVTQDGRKLRRYKHAAGWSSAPSRGSRTTAGFAYATRSPRCYSRGSCTLAAPSSC